jgi:ADP-ribose pyrophosphatase YjhB (NUDIX family)
MKILKTISDKDVGFDNPAPEVYKERIAVRIILFNNLNQVALLHSKKYFFHKIGGGGVEEGEDALEALKREALEELGCKLKNIREFGIVEEYYNYSAYHQMSCYFLANLEGEVGQNKLQGYEIDHDYEVLWFNIAEVISILEKEFLNYPEKGSMSGRFVLTRDPFILREVEKVLGLY